MVLADPFVIPEYAARVIRAEFTEMPGMHLTLAQAVRLWSLSIEQCERVLDALVCDGFLVRDEARRYARRGNAR
jgi:hypothetical protein